MAVWGKLGSSFIIFFRTFCFLCYRILRHPPLCVALLPAIHLKLLVRWYVGLDAASIFRKCLLFCFWTAENSERKLSGKGCGPRASYLAESLSFSPP